MKDYVRKLKADNDGKKLTRAEIMQFVNLRPITVSTKGVDCTCESVALFLVVKWHGNLRHFE